MHSRDDRTEVGTVRVYVDEAVCQGHTLCAMAAPGIFRLRDEDGHAYVTLDELTPEEYAQALKAASTCPEGAIIVDPRT